MIECMIECMIEAQNERENAAVYDSAPFFRLFVVGKKSAT